MPKTEDDVLADPPSWPTATGLAGMKQWVKYVKFSTIHVIILSSLFKCTNVYNDHKVST